jgi:type II secretory pathway pseudopilin PulG
MKSQSKSHGFGVVEIILVVVVIALIGLIAYRAWDANVNKSAQSSEQQNTAQSPDAPQIQSSKDLDTAATALDNTDIDGSSETELDEQISF